MITLLRIFIVGLIAWILWQFAPLWSVSFVVLYVITFVLYHTHRMFKSINWVCPEPWDFDTWEYHQSFRFRESKSIEERWYWHDRYLERFPEGVKQWNMHKDNPYG